MDYVKVVKKIPPNPRRIVMAKKKACKKSCAKKCSKKKCEQTPQENKDTGFELKPLSKQDYFFGLIKRAFGYE